MIVKRCWIIYRKRKGLGLAAVDTWRVTRVGWFLFGLVPLYVKDVEIELAR